jgi:hypothetical protein
MMEDIKQDIKQELISGLGIRIKNITHSNVTTCVEVELLYEYVVIARDSYYPGYPKGSY